MINSHYSIDTQHGVSSPLNLMTEDIFWITESLNKEQVQIMSKEDLVTVMESPVWLNIIHSDQEKILLIKSKTLNHIFGLVIFVLDHAFAKQLKGIRELLVQGAQILTSAVFHQKIIHENETQIKFEQALSDLSGRFINLPADKIDSEINQGLKRIADFFKVETGTLYANTPEHPKGQLTHAWTKKGKRMPARGTLISEDDYPYLSKRHHMGKITHVSSIENLPDEAHIDKMTLRKFKSKSILSIPLEVGGRNVGVVSFNSIEREVKWATSMINRGVVIGQIFANALARKYAEESLHHSYNEIKKLKNRLQTENLYFRKEIKLQHNFDEILGKSEAIKYVLFKIEQCAPTDATVVIMGETGTGKELIARAVHDKSLRRDKPLIKIDCGSLQGTLIERELFGHEKGAFTGAHQQQAGRFEIADGGTLFLDEIGELPLDLQPKLLRVLQEGEFERLGSPKVRKVDIRFIAATNRDLKQEVEQGRFRKDLWYRLFVFPIMIPPLRERKEDIPILVNWFVNRFNKKMNKKITHIPKKTLDELVQRPWTGNVRELENTIERKVITSQGDTLSLSNDSWGKAPEETEVNSGISLEDVEREHILSVLKKTKWRIYGPKGAALILGLNPSTLRFRIKKLGLKKPDKKNVGIQKKT
jgi:formate hydrogenlyase transcriptional activator